MWTPILFTLLVAAASAEYGWKPSSEYRYEVRSKTLASLHQVSNQYSGVDMRAQLTVTPKSDSHLYARISKAEYAQVQTQLPAGLDYEIPEDQLEYKKLPLTSQTFEIKLKNGVVDELVISKEVPIWEVNIIRSIVSQLQVDTQGKNLIRSKLNMIPQHDQNTAVYKIMEDTVDGECETLYDITPLPKYTLQRMPYLAPQPQLAGQGQMIDVVKTKNFSNCEQRPGYHFGLTGMTDWEPTSNDMGNFLARSSVSRVILSGSLKSYTIQSSVTTNKVILSPELYNSQKGEVVSRVNLTLSSVHAASQEIQGPTNPQTIKKLVYDYNQAWTKDHEAREQWDQRQESSESSSSSSSSSSESQEQKQKQIRNRREIEIDQEQNRSTYQKKQKNSSSSSSSSESKEQRNQQKKHQNASSSSSSSSSSSESSSISSSEEWVQETPKMIQAPQNPFLPYFVGYMGHSIQSSKDVNVNQVVKKLAEKIAEQLQNPNQIQRENPLDRFTILTHVISTMNVKQLEQATQELYAREQPQQQQSGEVQPTQRTAAWMVFRDAVAQAGTGPSLMIIKSWIQNHQVQGEEAAQIVATLSQTARTPTAEYMREFFELVKKPEVINQAWLNTSAIYSFSNLVRMAQVSRDSAHNRYPVHAFGRLSPKHEKAVVEEYIPYMAQQLNKAVEQEDSHKIQVYIRALGNMAHPKIVRVFEPYLEGQKPMTDFQRTLVIVSLNKLAKVHPKLARSVLYKTYANTGEAYQVRVAAVYNLMKTNPPASMLQRMAEFTHEDPSNQVRSAVKSAIESAAQLKDQANAELRQNAQSAIHMLTEQQFGVHYSHQNLTDYIVEGLNLAYTQSVNYIGSEDSLIPHTVFYHLRRNVNGYKHYSIGAGAMVSSMDDLTDLLEDKFDSYWQYNQQRKQQQQQPEQQQYQDKEFSYEKISQILNLENKITKQLEGNLLINWAGTKRFYTFDNHTIEALPQQLRQWAHLLQNGKSFNYQKMYNQQQITIALPTVTGLPFIYSLTVPTLISANGKVRVQTQQEKQQEQGPFAIPQTINVTSDIQLLYVSRVQAHISFITPFDHQRYIAGHDRNVQFTLPIKTKIDLDVKNRHYKVEIRPLSENKEHKIFHYSTWPYTSRQDILDFKPLAENKNTQKIQVRQPQRFEQQYGEKSTGIVVRVQGETQKKWVDFKTMYEQAQRHDIISALLYPTTEQTLEHTKIDLYFDAKRSSAKSIILTASYDQSYKHEQQEQQVQESENRAVPTSQSVDSQTRRQEFLQRVKQGIKDAQAKVIDLGLQIQGEKPVQYVATVAYASSPVDEQSRLLSYLRKVEGEQKYEVCLDAASQMPRTPLVNFIRALEDDQEGQVKAQLYFGEQCKNGGKVQLAGKLQRSQERKQYLQQHPLTLLAKRQMEKGYKLQPAQWQVAKEANVLDQYYFTMKYENIPRNIQNMTYQVYSVMRHLGYPYMSENPISQNEQGKINLKVQFARDLKSVDVDIQAPVGNAQFQHIRLNPYVSKALTVHPVYSSVRRIASDALGAQYDASCTIEKSTIWTFDNQSFPIHLGKVWHVMMIANPSYDFDSSSASDESDVTEQVVVLARDNESEQKEITLVFDGEEKVVIRVLPRTQDKLKARVLINEQEVTISTDRVYEFRRNDRTLLQVFGMPTGEVRLWAPLHKIELLHYGESVRLTVGQTYMDDVKGLCGTHNGDNFDFITPQGYVLQKPEEFAATWALSNEGRIAEMKQRAQEHSLYKKQVVLSNVVSEQDAGRADSRGRLHKTQKGSAQDYDSSSSSSSSSSSEESNESKLVQKGKSSINCETKRIVVVEKDGKHCFSLEPERACTSKCQPGKTQTKTGKFYCVEKSSTSSHWEKMVQRGANPNFANKGNSEEMKFEYPTECIRN